MLPMTPAALLPRWEDLHSRGLISFIARYGILRFSLILFGAVMGGRLIAGAPSAIDGMRLLLAALVFVLAGVVWALFTWQVCERRFRAR